MEYNHLLKCSHCCNGKGQSSYEYTMKCRIIKSMPNSHRIKIAVIGNRYWKGKFTVERVRYVESCRVT